MAEIELQRARPRSVGQYFIGGGCPGDRNCPATCYRGYDWGIALLCDHGCSAGAWVRGSGIIFAGSAFQARLNDLPAFAPFVQAVTS